MVEAVDESSRVGECELLQNVTLLVDELKRLRSGCVLRNRKRVVEVSSVNGKSSSGDHVVLVHRADGFCEVVFDRKR